MVKGGGVILEDLLHEGSEGGGVGRIRSLILRDGVDEGLGRISAGFVLQRLAGLGKGLKSLGEPGHGSLVGLKVTLASDDGIDIVIPRHGAGVPLLEAGPVGHEGHGGLVDGVTAGGIGRPPGLISCLTSGARYKSRAAVVGVDVGPSGFGVGLLFALALQDGLEGQHDKTRNK